MRPDPDSTLQRDLFATAAARLRRSLRRRRLALLSVPTMAALAALGALTMRPGATGDPLALARSSSPAAPTRPPHAPVVPAPPYQTLTTDAELLAALADQGPMLITHPDGRRQLILTRR